jgi:3D (Asp-Asp-Asp) domain-containing protein
MTYLTSYSTHRGWKRSLLLTVLTVFATVSMPLRVVAAEAVTPETTPVQADKTSGKTTAVQFTVPQKTVKMSLVSDAKSVPASTVSENAQVSETGFVPDKVREQTTGYKVVRVMNNVPSTAYTSRPQETDDTPFIAADGTHVYDGMVAANFLKFGTKIRIPELYGDKIFTVHDRMNKRYNVKVDIWMTNLKDAYKHGLRHITIEILEPVKDDAKVATTQS